LPSRRRNGLVALGTLGLVASSALVAGPASAAPRHHGHWSREALVSGRARVLANGTDTTRVFLKHFGPDHGASQSVALSTSATPSGGGSCGTLKATSGTTGHHGFFATVYTASGTVGFCTITATSGALTTSTTVDQVDPTLAAAKTRYHVQAVATPTRIKADGLSTSTITLTVQNGTTPVAGDAIWLSGLGRFGHSACGAIALSSPTTNASGQVTARYTSTTSPGHCVIRATEAATGRSSRVVVIHQR
jgi:hypothetical protein